MHDICMTLNMKFGPGGIISLQIFTRPEFSADLNVHDSVHVRAYPGHPYLRSLYTDFMITIG